LKESYLSKDFMGAMLHVQSLF